MKTKILFLITKSNFGGAQRYVYDLATSLPPETYDVTVGLGGNGMLKGKLDAAGIRTISIPGLERNVRIVGDIFVFVRLLRLFHREAPDIIHVNSSKIGGVGGLAGRVAGIESIVFTAHGWAFNEDRPWLVRAVIFFLHWLTVLLSTTTIAVSESVKRQISRAPFVKGKIAVVRNGIREITHLPRNDARVALAEHHEALGRYTDDKYIWIGTVAELHPTKNLRYAIEAIDAVRSKAPQVRYVIAGDGDQRAELEALVANRNLTEHVFFLGHVDGAPQYGKAYDVFLLPSRSEALNLAILEAGQASLPVVATNVGGIPEIIVHGETGLLIPPQDATAIEEALARLIGDEPLQKRLGEALRERVRRDFSLPRMLAETSTLYEKS